MKISPMAAPYNSVQAPQDNGGFSPTPRTLQMRTNATPPPRHPAQVEEYAGAIPKQQKLPISTTDEASAGVDEVTQPLSPQFAALAKQRRALQVKERALADRERALSDPGQEMVDKALLKKQPMRVLLENGVTYEQLTEEILKNQGNSEVYELKAELEALRTGVDKKLSDRDQESEKQALAEMNREAKSLAQTDDFELIREWDAVPDVMRLIEVNFKETGEVLDVSEAMQLVEDQLFERAKKVSGFKKLQQQRPAAQAPQGMRTLTNRDTASVPSSARDRAMAAFYGQLR